MWQERILFFSRGLILHRVRLDQFTATALFSFFNAQSCFAFHQKTKDNLHRWMGSIAQDRKGNIALGYSVSSSMVFPVSAPFGSKTSCPVSDRKYGF
jgi:hypothetical protein